MRCEKILFEEDDETTCPDLIDYIITFSEEGDEWDAGFCRKHAYAEYEWYLRHTSTQEKVVHIRSANREQIV